MFKLYQLNHHNYRIFESTQDYFSNKEIILPDKSICLADINLIKPHQLYYELKTLFIITKSGLYYLLLDSKESFLDFNNCWREIEDC